MKEEKTTMNGSVLPLHTVLHLITPLAYGIDFPYHKFTSSLLMDI